MGALLLVLALLVELLLAGEVQPARALKFAVLDYPRPAAPVLLLEVLREPPDGLLGPVGFREVDLVEEIQVQFVKVFVPRVLAILAKREEIILVRQLRIYLLVLHIYRARLVPFHLVLDGDENEIIVLLPAVDGDDFVFFVVLRVQLFDQFLLFLLHLLGLVADLEAEILLLILVAELYQVLG